MDGKKLVRMANQIADFFASGTDHRAAVEGVAGHLQKFWEPRMRKKILAMVDAGTTDGMAPLVLEALRAHRVQIEPQG